MSLFRVLFCAKCLHTDCNFISFCYKLCMCLCSCPHGVFTCNFCLKHFGHWLCSFHFILLCACHIFVHKSFWHVILINCRIWYKGAAKYLGESVTGSEIGIQNWQVSSCVAIGTVRFVQWGCWQMHRQVGTCTRFSHQKGEQMNMTSFNDITAITLYVEGWEYIIGSTHELKAIIWVFGSCTPKLPCEKPPTLCCIYFSASHGVRVHLYRKVLFICSATCAQGYLGYPYLVWLKLFGS